LKNKGNLLPLTGVKSIAVIGDDAGAAASIQATNSVVPIGNKLSVPSEAITARAGSGVKVVYEKGTMGIAPLTPIPASAWQGLQATYYKESAWAGEPVAKQADANIDFNATPVAALNPAPPAGAAAGGRGGRGPRAPRIPWSAKWEGSLLPPSTGMYRLSLNSSGTARVLVNN